MEDWTYCQEVLPKVSRTFALNIRVLDGEIKRSVLVAYLFCRIVDTVEDAAKLEVSRKRELLLRFSQLIQDDSLTATDLATWISDCRCVDGSDADLDLLFSTDRVFRVFETLPVSHRERITQSVSEMAVGMAYFQGKFAGTDVTPLEDEKELEEYCYFVAGLVGEMLCNLFIETLPQMSDRSKSILREKAVSFGLGLQMTNISKDVMADRSRGWSYVPRSFIVDEGLTLEEFGGSAFQDKSLKVLDRLLTKTMSHLEDALTFTQAIPASAWRIRLFCIWPLWMAMETAVTLHKNKELLISDAEVKISRQTVRRILRRTHFLCFFNPLLSRSFFAIQSRSGLVKGASFDLIDLKERVASLDLITDRELN